MRVALKAIQAQALCWIKRFFYIIVMLKPKLQCTLSCNRRQIADLIWINFNDPLLNLMLFIHLQEPLSLS